MIVPEWISGFEGYYSVTRCGKINSHISSRGVKELKGGMTTRIVRGEKIPQYKIVALYRDTVQTMMYVHRIVAEAFHENPEGKPFVNHKDGNKVNNNCDNLEWCTHQENVDHYHASETPVYKTRVSGETLSQRADHSINVSYVKHHKKNFTQEDFDRNGLPNLLSTPCVKLNYRETWRHVIKLFDMIDGGSSLAELSEELDMDKGQLCRIRSGQTYRDARILYDKFKNSHRGACNF